MNKEPHNYSDLEILKTEKLKEYKALVEQARLVQEDIQALDRSISLLKKLKNPDSLNQKLLIEPSESEKPRPIVRGITGGIRRVVQEIDGKFTMDDVIKKASALNAETMKEVKRVQISWILSQMARKGEIQIVQKGSGKIQNVFQRK